MDIVEFTEKLLDRKLLDLEKKFLIELNEKVKPAYINVPKYSGYSRMTKMFRTMVMSKYGIPKGDDKDGQTT